jgi:predicted nucleic acid-binding protein
MNKTRIYLDNCTYNRPFDDKTQLTIRMEAEAKLQIQEDIRNGIYELVWSYMNEFENNDNPYSDRREQIGRWEVLASKLIAYTPQIETQANAIMTLGIKKKDAVHIACALAANADYFITTDKKILNKVVAGITIINPIDFVRRHSHGN